jgi:alginate O-acetyltransferase complex protein AlgI
MVFSSNIFLFAFLPLTLFLYFLSPQKNYKNILLLAASLIFYAWGEAQYLLLLLVSIAANYFFGILLSKPSLKKRVADHVSDQTGDSRIVSLKSPDLTSFGHPLFQRGLILFLAIAFNLLLLGYFKYANFLIENLNQFFSLQIKNEKIHLPIGISFFTFHAISYLVDIYRGKCAPQKNFFSLALYIAFFPQLIAGPIVRYNFIEKYLGKRRHNLFFAAYGIRRFIIGLGKKIIIANPLGEMADAIFNSPLSELNSALAWFGLVCYTLQIYFDFSGYSDMAVGLARIFGFKFPENFNYPYISRSIKEFWRRWHISLSAWFRDYVYIPLGGNRVSLSRQYFNLILVFFLCGFWHGASWNFVIWGMFHGFFLVAERVISSSSLARSAEDLVKRNSGDPRFYYVKSRMTTCGVELLQNFYAIFVVMIGWVFFRSSDLAYSFGFLKTMFFGNEVEIISSEIARLSRSYFLWMIFAFALVGFSPLTKKIALKLMRKNKIFVTVIDLFLIVILLLTIVRISASTYNPFIYFQF